MKLLEMPLTLGNLARRLAIPVLVALTVGAAATIASQVIREREAVFISMVIDTEAARLESQTGEAVAQRLQAIQSLASRVEREPQITEEAWRIEARRLLNRDLQFRAVEWVDPALSMRWVEPATARVKGQALDPADDSSRLDELKLIEDQPDPSITRSYDVTNDHRQVMLCAPMFSGARGIGFMVGVMRVRDLCDAVYQQALSDGYTVAVYEEPGPFHIYGASWLKGGPEVVWARDNNLSLGTHTWRVQAWPGAELLREMRTPMPQVILWSGIALGVLLGLTIFLLQGWRQRARLAEAAARAGGAEAPAAETRAESTDDPPPASPPEPVSTPAPQ